MFGGGVRGWLLGLMVMSACHASAECWFIPPTFDVEAFQKQVTELGAKLGVAVARVDCGDPPPEVIKGARFSCNVHLSDGQVAPVDVHVPGVDGTYDWKIRRLVDIGGIIEDIRSSAKKDHGIEATVACPHAPVGVYAKGEHVTCTVTRPGAADVTLAIDITDDDGATHWKIVPR